MKIAMVIGVFAALSCTAALSAQSAGVSGAGVAQTATKPVPAKTPERVICRVDDDTGSRIAKKKVCMTAAQWRDSSYRSGEFVEHMTSQVGKPGGN